VRDRIKQQDQSYSKQPGLVAHPSSLAQTPGCRLDQLSPSSFAQFVKHGFVG
jgi:hypothetical protein